MVAFYKHDVPSWMDGTEALSDGAYRTYHVVVQLIMLNEGPIALAERGIAGRCNQSIKAFRRNLAELIEVGKLVLIDGRLSNRRAESELASIELNRRNASLGGRKSGKTRGKVRKNSAEVVKNSDEPPTGVAKSLTNNDPAEATLPKDRSLKEKRREEKNTPIVPKGTEPEGFVRFREAYPRRSTRFPSTPALKRWQEAIRRGADPEAIIAGAKGYAAEQQRIGKVGTEYVQTADVWLNKQRWLDYATPEPQAEALTAGNDYLAKLTDERWRGDVRRWNRGLGDWILKSHTRPPDHPDTKVPRHILAEFGLVPAERRPIEPVGAMH